MKQPRPLLLLLLRLLLLLLLLPLVLFLHCMSTHTPRESRDDRPRRARNGFLYQHNHNINTNFVARALLSTRCSTAQSKHANKGKYSVYRPRIGGPSDVRSFFERIYGGVCVLGKRGLVPVAEKKKRKYLDSSADITHHCCAQPSPEQELRQYHPLLHFSRSERGLVSSLTPSARESAFGVPWVRVRVAGG